MNSSSCASRISAIIAPLSWSHASWDVTQHAVAPSRGGERRRSQVSRVVVPTTSWGRAGALAHRYGCCSGDLAAAAALLSRPARADFLLTVSTWRRMGCALRDSGIATLETCFRTRSASVTLVYVARRAALERRSPVHAEPPRWTGRVSRPPEGASPSTRIRGARSISTGARRGSRRAVACTSGSASSRRSWTSSLPAGTRCASSHRAQRRTVASRPAGRRGAGGRIRRDRRPARPVAADEANRREEGAARG